MQQQRDALLIICIPCIDSKREGGELQVSRKQQEHQELLDNVLEGGGVLLFEVGDKKGRSERKGMRVQQYP